MSKMCLWSGLCSKSCWGSLQHSPYLSVARKELQEPFLLWDFGLKFRPFKSCECTAKTNSALCCKLKSYQRLGPEVDRALYICDYKHTCVFFMPLPTQWLAALCFQSVCTCIHVCMHPKQTLLAHNLLT